MEWFNIKVTSSWFDFHRLWTHFKKDYTLYMIKMLWAELQQLDFMEKVFRIVNSFTYFLGFLLFKCSVWLEKNRAKNRSLKGNLTNPSYRYKYWTGMIRPFFLLQKSLKISIKNKKCWKYEGKKIFSQRNETFFENAHFLLLYSSLNMHLSSLCIFLKINQNLVQIFFREIRLVFFSPKTFVFAKIKTSFEANQNSVKRKATWCDLRMNIKGCFLQFKGKIFKVGQI